MPLSHLTRINDQTWYALAGLVAVVLGGSLVTATAIRQLNENTGLVMDSHEVVEQVDELLRHLTDAETGQRGYLLTGDQSYLAPYFAASEAIGSAYRRTLELTEDDVEQNARLRELKPLIDEKLAELAETIALHDAGKRDQALEIVRSDRGKRLMVGFRQQLAEVQRQERRRLDERSRTRDRARTIGYVTVGVLTAAELATLALLVWIMRQFLRQVTAARERAELASRSRGEFLANMSHEIRTPMTAILGFADILRDRVADPDDRQLVDTISGNGNHLLRILNDILDLSKIDAGQLTVERQPTPLEPLAADLYSTLTVLSGRKAIAFEIEFDNPVPARLYTDSIRLRQILFNLIGNAIKFTEKGRVLVRFGFDEAANELVVRVIDSGVGIDPSKLDTIFLPFEQQDNSTTRTHGGTGLGLSICQRLAEALGGSIEATSEPGKGSTFTLRIDCGDLTDVDLIHATLTVKRDRSSAAVPGNRMEGRVLVVDDRREMRFLVRRLIERAGGEVIEAENGSEALKMLLSDEEFGASIDACVLDMQMPIMDGYETARKLRDRNLPIPILALTANSMTEDRERCLRAGCSDYLSKPIDAGALITKLVALTAPQADDGVSG